MRKTHPKYSSSPARAGRIPVLLMFLLSVVIAVLGLFFVLSQNVRDRQMCEGNMKSIYSALVRYEADHGKLPTLAYFPPYPQTDADSLPVVLVEKYIADSRTCVCPALHSALRDKGLTYVWNTSLSSAPIPRNGAPRWMLVEMTAISRDLPAPHMGRYNVLYTDGSVKRVADPIRELPGL